MFLDCCRLQDLLTRNLAAYDEFDAAARDTDDAGFGPSGSRTAGAGSEAPNGVVGAVNASAAVGAASPAQSPVLRSLPSVGSSAQLMRAFSQLGSGERGMLSPQARRTFGGLQSQPGGRGGPESDLDSAVVEAATVEEEDEDGGDGMGGEADEETVDSADELHSL